MHGFQTGRKETFTEGVIEPDRRKSDDISNREERGSASCSQDRGLRRWESNFIVKMESNMSRVDQTQ